MLVALRLDCEHAWNRQDCKRSTVNIYSFCPCILIALYYNAPLESNDPSALLISSIKTGIIIQV